MSKDSSSQSPHLGSLLAKLRPFQRSAFEFAVSGAADPSGKPSAKRNKNYAEASSDGWVTKSKSPRQIAGAGTGRLLIGDEMGLGKTLTSLAIMLAYQQTEWPLLILCPASLRYTWPGEIEKFCPWIPAQSIHVVRGKDDVHFAKQIHRWREKKEKKTCPVQIVIVTYSLLQNRFQIANVLKDCGFQCVIADESHNLKQLSSQRCQLAMPILQSSKRCLLLSGTPALNRPVELWPQLLSLDPKGRMFGKGMSYTEYTKRYCNAKRTRFGWDVKGVSRPEELNQSLRRVMIRRLKADVLQDLPAKQRSIVPVGIDKERERECRDNITMLGAAREAVMSISLDDADDEANAANFEARQLLNQAYQTSGVAKAPATTEYILDWLEGSDPSQKLVVFAHHKQVIDYIETTISKKYKGKLGMMRIDGSVPPAERALRVKKFQNNKNCRLAILSVTAAGVGLTLTAASNIVFAELHWVPGVLAQAEDRCHRIGQANSVNVMYCICKDEDLSVDMILWRMLSRKVGSLGRVVDGQKGSCLNAEEVDGSSKISGKSVEEELQNFFATSKVSGNKSAKKDGPVIKGSIQSFFKKQSDKTPSQSSKQKRSATTGLSSKRKNADCISLLDDDDDDDDEIGNRTKLSEAKRRSQSQAKPKPQMSCISLLDEDECKAKPRKSSPPAKSNEESDWACHLCTYLNPAKRSTCELCNNERQTNVSNLKESKVEEWRCLRCTLLNSSDLVKCEVCGLDKGQQESNREKSGTPRVSLDNDQPDEEFEDDNDWNEADFVQIDQLVTSSKKKARHHAPISQSPCDVQVEPKSAARSIRNVGTTEQLSFSVSLNSGRIALHESISGSPLHVNFDLATVLTKDCSEELEDVQLQRMSSTSVKLQYDSAAIRQVLSVLEGSRSLSHSSTPHFLDNLCKEVKQFISAYLGLREVEKKLVKESRKPFTGSMLKVEVSRMLVSSVNGSTERYTTGAKERALLNLRNGCCTSDDNAVLKGTACAWCGKPNMVAQGSTYCSFECAEEGRVKRGGLYSSSKIREQVFALERGVCQLCGVDSYALFQRIKALEPPERLNALLKAKWKLPQGKRSVDRLLQMPEESMFWQADHEVAVAEGGGGTGLDNLRTLCTPCHAAETEKLLSRLKTSNQSNGQMDIFAALSNLEGKKKRKRVAD